MTNAQPEPSMEEILASIRRIISEDEEEDASGAAPTAAHVEAPAETEAAVEESVVVLEPEPADEPLAEIKEPEETISDDAPQVEADEAEPRLNTEDVEMIKTETREAIERDAPMIGEASASAATQAFQNLSQTVRVSGGEGHTLEDIVMELLRPMLKDWLDQNLAVIVEEKVEEEVQRLARRGR